MTLIELLVVIGIIATLAGLSYPLYLTVFTESKTTSTRLACLEALVAATNHPIKNRSVIVDGSQRYRNMWDLDQDGIIDGDPGHPDAPAALRRVAPDGYRGLGYTVGIDHRWLDDQGRVVDAWNNPLRISFGDPEHVEIGIWSLGEDRIDQRGAATSDDIASWRTSEP